MKTEDISLRTIDTAATVIEVALTMMMPLDTPKTRPEVVAALHRADAGLELLGRYVIFLRDPSVTDNWLGMSAMTAELVRQTLEANRLMTAAMKAASS
jgi:hypothetical protein